MILEFNTPTGVGMTTVDMGKLREDFGGKGANLWIMTNDLNLPVPPGFTISTHDCRAYMLYQDNGNGDTFLQVVSDEISLPQVRLEKAMDRKLGDKKKPLLVSVRSGAKVSMPGMMDTILNLGLNDETVVGLAEMTNEDFAYDSYRRFLAMYGSTVVGVDKGYFDRITNAAKRFAAGRIDSDLNAILIQQFKETLGDRFPQDVHLQLLNAIEAVFKSWNSERAIAYREAEKIPHDWGTAVTVQAMVFGNMNDSSGTGVVFTRNPSNGENTPYGDFLVNAQGEDVVDGSHVAMPISEMERLLPSQYSELSLYMEKLETFFSDMCDIEFTIEDGKLWILQTRTGKRSATAAVRIALEMHKDDYIDSQTATSRILAATEGLGSTANDDDGRFNLEIGEGLGACQGIAVGRVAFNLDQLEEMVEQGDDVILVRNQTEPGDVKAMAKAVGILTMFGGLVSHAAVVARGWNKVCVVSASVNGLKINSTETKLKWDGGFVTAGEHIKIDGKTGKVYVQG